MSGIATDLGLVSQTLAHPNLRGLTVSAVLVRNGRDVTVGPILSGTGGTLPPVLSIAMTLDGVPVIPAGGPPWTYQVPDAESDLTLVATVTVTQGVETSSSKVSEVFPKNITPPDFVTPARISGVLGAGLTILLDPGTWSGQPVPQLDWVLQHSPNGIDSWSDYPGTANAGSYTLGPGDLGGYLRLRVTGQNTHSISPRTLYSAVEGPVPTAPSFEMVVTTENTIEIDGITGAFEITVIAPVEYAGIYTTDVTGQVLNPATLAEGPLCIRAPRISGSGTLQIGDFVTALPGLWLYDTSQGGVAVSRQWRADGAGDEVFADIPGATSTRFQLTAAEAGDTLELREVAVTDAGTRAVLSDQLAASFAPVNARVTPQNTIEVDNISGIFTILVTEPAIYAGLYTQDVTGATLTAETLAQGPLCLKAPVLDVLGGGAAVVGSTLKVTDGLWVHDIAAAPPVLSWQWQSDLVRNRIFSDIPGAVGSDYTVTLDERSDGIRVIETADQGAGLARSAISSSLDVT